MQDFRQLKVWQKSHQFTLEVYRLTQDFPKHELYGLTSQLRRSASSVPTNLAEGCGRGSDQDLARFVQMAMGSACEAEYQLMLAGELGYLTTEEEAQAVALVQEVKRMLASFLKTLKSKP